MIHVTIVGAGAYGALIANKYKKCKAVDIRAVVSRRKPASELFADRPFFHSAAGWKKSFGSPGNDDFFDLCVHQPELIAVLKDFVVIGAKNFILPKPIALTAKELSQIENLVAEHKLKVLISSQWHYSALVKQITSFIKKNKAKIASVEINFSRSFEGHRQKIYTATTAFLPHMVQILLDTSLIKNKSPITISDYSKTKVKITYPGKINVNLGSDLTVKTRTESLKVFFKGSLEPTLVVNFAGVLGPEGFVVYPSITIGDKQSEVCEDVLEQMLNQSATFFAGKGLDKNILTLDTYLPVAKELVRIVERGSKIIAVIGGGVFGIMAALKMAKLGYSVVIFEKEPEIITAASLVNHCRVHMGYHYPRDLATVRESMKAKDPFEKFFGPTVVRKIDNYYMVASDGSLTPPADFLKFCTKMKLPYTVEWPKKVTVSAGKVALSIKVPEKIFDASRKRDFLKKNIAETPGVTLIAAAEITGMVKQHDGFDLVYKQGGEIKNFHCAAVINASYSGLNQINNMLGLPLRELKYELCEIMVVQTPWHQTGWMIMDGPFFSAMPFGFSDQHLFYDVELSVLERKISTFPTFDHDVAYYNQPNKSLKRFSLYKDKWRSWVPEVDQCEYVSSMYVVRVILPKQEKTDARPTIVDQLKPGFWQIFSGKVGTSVPVADKLSAAVDRFLKNKKKD